MFSKLAFKGARIGPNGTVMFANGPVVTQPPPVPGGIVMLIKGVGGRLILVTISDRFGMNSPLPDML